MKLSCVSVLNSKVKIGCFILEFILLIVFFIPYNFGRMHFGQVEDRKFMA